MRNKFPLLIILLSLFFVACNRKDPVDQPDKPKTNQHRYVNDWIFKEMNTYYLWNSKIPKSPDYTLSSDKFFGSMLYTYNENTNPDGDRFSWIQEDYIELLNSLSGVVSDEIGFEFVRVGVSNESPKQYYLLVLYPKKDTDAERQGVRKGDFITSIDNEAITEINYRNLTGGSGQKKLNIARWVHNEGNSKPQLEPAIEITVQMHKNFAENPIYLDSIYTTPANGKKVGYLVYNFFARDKGDGSNDYDRELINKLSQFNQAGVSELILDLRYNGGGAVSSAVVLASALVPNRNTSNLFSTTEYNALVHSALQQSNGKNYNKTYFANQFNTASGSIDIPQMNLQKLYVITSMWTASASELIINGLLPYFKDNLILIGETTVGKNVGSISIYEENDSKNKWGMQPIIAKYFNSEGKSDFTAGFTPNYKVDELEDLQIIDFGDTDDVLLNKALTLSNGAPLQAGPAKAPRTSSQTLFRVIKNSQSMLDKPGRNTTIDDIWADEIRAITTK